MVSKDQIWRKKLVLMLIVVAVLINPTTSTFSDNTSQSHPPNTVHQEAEIRTADGQIHIHYANRSTDTSNATRHSDQIMILGKSRITIPRDKANWPGVKIVTGDSYLKALEYSQNIRNAHGGAVEINSKSTQLIRREFNPSPIYKPETDQETRASAQIHPRILYPGPNAQNPYLDSRQDFSPPVQPASNFNAQPSYPSSPNDNPYDMYGPPPSSYDPYPPPQDAYGPPPYPDSYKPMQNPSPSYGYPAPVYGPPAEHNPHSFNMMSSMTNLLTWPLIKLNAVTLAKIVLKLVIFKMIIKFIGLVCLLLFIPKLEMKKGNMNETESEDRSMKDNPEQSYLDELTATVLTAIENFEKSIAQHQPKKDETCTTLWCLITNSFSIEKSDQEALE